MAASFVFDQGRDAFNWEAGLFNVDGNDGIFSEPRELAEADGSGLGSAHIDFNDWHLTFTSAGNDLTVASGDLTGGTVTSITLRSGSTSVIHLTGLSVSAATVQALLDGGAENGRDPLFLAVFASEATTFQGPPEGAMSAFGSAASDEYFLSAGGPDYVFNFIWTGGGVDTVHGSDGEDFVAYDVDQAVTVNFADGTVVKADTTSLGTFDDEVEDIAGSKFGDTFNGDDRDNRMFGNEGDDTFTGGDGDDFFVGGANDDLIDGGDGWDRLDFLMSVDQEQGVVVTYAAGTDFSGTATDSWGDTDTFSNIEDVRGGNFDDVFNGNDADNNFEEIGRAHV